MISRRAAPSSARPLARSLFYVAFFVVTIGALLATIFGLRLEPNVASLLPTRGEAAALRRWVRGFGGSDLSVVLVESPDAEDAEKAAAEIARGLSQQKASVKIAADRAELPHSVDPMRALLYADASARARLAAALTPEGMRERLRETRALLLAPGSSAMAETIAADPLRLAQLVFEQRGIDTGVRTQPNGAFATDDGKTRLVLVQPKGQALRGAEAKAFVRDAEDVLAQVSRAHPSLTLGLTGGHAIAAATETMLTRDFAISGTLSMVLAALVFALVFRRVRALVAVLPPLVLGTLWTMGLAALLPGGLSAIAVAFMSVVVGVGVDTGVHVYAALLDARRAGLSPTHAALAARKKTARAVLTAALTAGAAFASLALSDIHALRQLGILCGAGEILTAIAIVVVTPEIGALLERGEAPAEAPARWTEAIAWLTATRARAAVAAALALAPLALLALLGPPHLASAIVAVRPQKLAPLAVQEKIFAAFGGKHGQLVALVADPDLDRARTRADRIAERLSNEHDAIVSADALTAIAPSATTQRARLEAIEALDLRKKADELERALAETGFAPARFRAALEAMRGPPPPLVELSAIEKSPAAILASRYLGEDGGDRLCAIYIHPTTAPGAIERIERAVHEADPSAQLTGYGRLESSLRETLSHDLPRIGGVAALMVILALSASLRRLRDVILAALVVTAEVAAVLLFVRVFRIPLHAYDALVLPVLLGITVDEGMFMLHHARSSTEIDVTRDTLRREGPPIAATALTTAAGFFALAFCEFDGLRDLGLVGALGSTIGLVVALIVVPAGLRLSEARSMPRTQ